MSLRVFCFGTTHDATRGTNRLGRPTGGAKPPLVELLALALPTIVQMTSYTVMQFTDTFMLSRVSDTAATAAAQAGMVEFSLLASASGRSCWSTRW